MDRRRGGWRDQRNGSDSRSSSEVNSSQSPEGATPQRETGKGRRRHAVRGDTGVGEPGPSIGSEDGRDLPPATVHDGSSLGPNGSAEEGLARREGEAFVTETLAAVAHFVVQKFAMVHGLYPLYETIEYVSAVRQWKNVTEGGEVDVNVPIPLGHGIELDLSLYPGDGKAGSQLPITLSIAPSDLQSFGALAVDNVDIAPGAKTEDTRSDSIPTERNDRVGVVPVNLAAPELPKEPRNRAAAARWFVEKQLLPELRRNPDVRGAGIELVVVYDHEASLAMWVDLDDAGQPSWRVLIGLDAAGQLTVKVIDALM
jgi:hypothetical protein